ncbi:DUF1330 domain-containing protein [Streptomyces sp. NPDC000151]|uniref:DUF1330 domain-containing protein n=1 Tax=Streptomyces sp. NPDC000151 TaxID=3154244 RepID=UPI003328B7AD
MAVDPTGKSLKQFLLEDPDAPVVMLNLLRFAPGGGGEGYADYLRHFRPHAERVGATILYYGLGAAPVVAEPGQDWDAVLLVSYPSRHAFSEMVRDEDYQRGTHLRTSAVTEAVLQPTTDAAARVWGAGPAEAGH